MKNRLVGPALAVLTAAALSACGTAMSRATHADDVAKMQKLLAEGQDPNERARRCGLGCVDGWTPLIHAASYGQPEMARLLLDKGADVNALDESVLWPGWTALCHAAQGRSEQHVAVARLLIERGADPRAKCAALNNLAAIEPARTPLELARGLARNRAMVRFLEDPAEKGRRPPFGALSPAVLEHEGAGDAARAAGANASALKAYVSALKAAPAEVGADPRIEALRRKVIEFTTALEPRPDIPDEARAHAAKGQAFVKLAKEPADYQSAVAHFSSAVQSAPWWADAYLNCGLVQEKLGRYESAASLLEYFLLAEPGSPDAGAVRRKIAELGVLKEQADRAPARPTEREPESKPQPPVRGMGGLLTP